MSENYLNNLYEIFKGSEVVYKFLSRSYFEPVSDSYFQMLNDLKEYFTMLESDDNELLNKGIKGIVKVIDERNCLENNQLTGYDTEILREYTALFCLGSASIPVTESVYTSENNLEMQESRDDMLKLFSSEKINPRKLYNEPEDHIGFETYIMSLYNNMAGKLIEQQDLKSLKNIVDKQLYIYEEHLSKWLKIFTANILNSPIKKVFYDKLADFTEGYISENHKFLLDLKNMLVETNN